MFGYDITSMILLAKNYNDPLNVSKLYRNYSWYVFSQTWCVMHRALIISFEIMTKEIHSSPEL